MPCYARNKTINLIEILINMGFSGKHGHLLHSELFVFDWKLYGVLIQSFNPYLFVKKTTRCRRRYILQTAISNTVLKGRKMKRMANGERQTAKRTNERMDNAISIDQIKRAQNKWLKSPHITHCCLPKWWCIYACVTSRTPCTQTGWWALSVVYPIHARRRPFDLWSFAALHSVSVTWINEKPFRTLMFDARQPGAFCNQIMWECFFSALH